MGRVIVVGGGAAGMMAAIAAGRSGHRVTLLEKNEKLGKKIYITGKGRGNLTNACEVSEFFDSVPRNPKFLYSALYGFGATDMMDFMESHGVPVKVERGNRVFPASDHASDITKALEKEIRALGVEVRLYTEVKELLLENVAPATATPAASPSQSPADPGGGSPASMADSPSKSPVFSDNEIGRKINGVLTNGREKISADAVILATGGLSYQTTGSDGAGHRMLKAIGIKVTDCFPSLVGLTTAESDTHGLSGLSLKNVSLKIIGSGRSGRGGSEALKSRGGSEAVSGRGGGSAKGRGTGVLYEGFGEMLFTHNGISGPLGLSASSYITDKLTQDKTFRAFIDIKSALDKDALYDRICRDIDASPKKELSFLMNGLLPKSLAAVVSDRLGIDKRKHLCDVTKQERQAMVDILKGFELTVTGTGGFKEAIITRGGVDVHEIDPSTMRVKSVEGLYVAGELIDVDALTGGYNLQIAFSTGYLAGSSL